MFGLRTHIILGTGNSRNIPDVAGNADLRTGYAIFVSGNKVSLKAKTHQIIKTPVKMWLVDGGTSYTSPQMAGANAVMNSGRQTPIGFWNPQIYKFAQEGDSHLRCWTVLIITTTCTILVNPGSYITKQLVGND